MQCSDDVSKHTNHICHQSAHDARNKTFRNCVDFGKDNHKLSQQRHDVWTHACGNRRKYVSQERRKEDRKEGRRIGRKERRKGGRKEGRKEGR